MTATFAMLAKQYLDGAALASMAAALGFNAGSSAAAAIWLSRRWSKAAASGPTART